MKTLPPLSSESSASQPLLPANRVDALLILRAFACLMVVIIHCAPPRKAVLYQTIDLSWLTFSHGLVAVWIFFCLSGYLMGKAFYSGRYSLDLKGVLMFWRNRALRILPLYYFTVFILAVFVYPDILKFENWGYLVHLCSFTYSPWLTTTPLLFNGVMWSLSTEVQFYLFVPFLYAIFQPARLKRRWIIPIMVLVVFIVFSLKLLIWIAFRAEITDSMYYAFNYWYAPLVTNLDIFIIGFLLNPLLQSRRSANFAKNHIHTRFSSFQGVLGNSYKLVAIVLLVLLYLFTANHFYHQELWGFIPKAQGGFRTSTTIFVLQPLTAVVTAIFICAFEACSSSEEYDQQNQQLSFAAILDNPCRFLEIFGNLSYGVYLWHAPIVAKITPIFTSDVPIEAFYLRLTATLLLSIAMATLTYYLVELPAGQWKVYRHTS